MFYFAWFLLVHCIKEICANARKCSIVCSAEQTASLVLLDIMLNVVTLRLVQAKAIGFSKELLNSSDAN